MNPNLKKAYDSLPTFFQNIILSGYSVLLDKERYGGQFRQFKEFLDKSQWFSEEEIKAYQKERLKIIIQHAYETVPYYQKKFKQINIKPEDISCLEDLHKLPVLTRKDIIENFDDLRSRSYKRSQLKLGHTSGTTGSPLEILYDKNIINMTYAVLDRQYSWANTKLKKFGDKVALLRGNVIVPVDKSKPPFWRYNYYHNHLLLSSFHLSSNNLTYYIDELKKFKPAVIDGYPSTVYVLANYLKSTGETLPVKAVLTSSETLYDFQRSLIEEVFGCKIFDYFGAAERVTFATECEKHEGHHLCDEYGITEVIDKNGEPLEKGDTGIMVGTSLHNLGMPMIRYASSDLTALKAGRCSCGRSLALMEDITTKSEDIIALRDGRMISPSVLTHPFKPMHTIEASQIVQEDYDHIIIKILPKPDYKGSDSEHLIKEFKDRMGEEVVIDVQLVKEMPRTKAGKFKWVISKVEKGIKMPNE